MARMGRKSETRMDEKSECGKIGDELIEGQNSHRNTQKYTDISIFVLSVSLCVFLWLNINMTE
jgi:hypothetical protein